MRTMLDWPFNPISQTPFGRHLAAACEVFENVTRRYGKPEFGLKTTRVGNVEVPVRERVVAATPFCNLLHFERDTSKTGARYDPKVLLVAPMSGHYATLLRGTVKAMLPEHDVYITDWIDARDIPLAMGRFDLDDFIDHVIDFIKRHRTGHARHRRVPAGGAGAGGRRAHGQHRLARASRPP